MWVPFFGRRGSTEQWAGTSSSRMMNSADVPGMVSAIELPDPCLSFHFGGLGKIWSGISTRCAAILVATTQEGEDTGSVLGAVPSLGTPQRRLLADFLTAKLYMIDALPNAAVAGSPPLHSLSLSFALCQLSVVWRLLIPSLWYADWPEGGAAWAWLPLVSVFLSSSFARLRAHSISPCFQPMIFSLAFPLAPSFHCSERERDSSLPRGPLIPCPVVGTVS